jgi:hypothetical protein
LRDVSANEENGDSVTSYHYVQIKRMNQTCRPKVKGLWRLVITLFDSSELFEDPLVGGPEFSPYFQSYTILGVDNLFQNGSVREWINKDSS